MEWNFTILYDSPMTYLIQNGLKIIKHSNQSELASIKSIVGVIGIPKTGKTMLINGFLKGVLQTI